MTTLAPGRIWASHPDGQRVDSLADIVRRRAAATPEAAAMIETTDAGDRVTTFADLDRRSSQVAQALRAEGVRAGDRVAYLGPNAPSFLEVLYGAAKIGAVTTALNNRLALAERQVILRDAEPTVLVLGQGEAELPVGDPATLRRVISATEYDGWLAAQSTEDPLHPNDPHDPTLIFYTSGTTGLPKGIMLSGDSIGQALATMHYEMELDTTSVAMAPIPYFHISGLGLAMVANLNGAALLLEMATEPSALVELLVRRRVSHAAVVPTLIQRMVNLPAARDVDWSALKYLVYGSAPMPLSIIQQATQLFGCKFLQSYGLTESTGGVTVLWPEDHLPSPDREQQLRSVGRAMPGVRLRVVDPETLEDVPVGTRGEVLVGGGHLMNGYWNRPEATAAVMTPDGWLRTGDGGSFDEFGYLYLHDRLKDMIVSGGENVFPAEIESVLTAHPAIAEVAVIGVASERWGESPYAVVVLQPRVGDADDAALLSARLSAELTDWAHERLARFKCPAGFDFVAALPRNASGKLLKNVLREQYATALS